MMDDRQVDPDRVLAAFGAFMPIAKTAISGKYLEIWFGDMPPSDERPWSHSCKWGDFWEAEHTDEARDHARNYGLVGMRVRWNSELHRPAEIRVPKPVTPDCVPMAARRARYSRGEESMAYDAQGRLLYFDVEAGGRDIRTSRVTVSALIAEHRCMSILELQHTVDAYARPATPGCSLCRGSGFDPMHPSMACQCRLRPSSDEPRLATMRMR